MRSFGRPLLAPQRSRRKAKTGSRGHNALKLGRSTFVSGRLHLLGVERSHEATIPGARTTAESGRSDQLVQFIDPALAMLDPVQCMLDRSGMLDFGTPNVV